MIIQHRIDWTLVLRIRLEKKKKLVRYYLNYFVEQIT